MAEPQLSVPSRPRLVLVGPLRGLRTGREVRANLDTTTASPEDMLRLLPTSPPDALVLDASVEWARVEPMVKVLAALDDASRPAVVLFAPEERRPRPKAALLELAREFIPFREIGGDYYDFLTLGPHRLALAIGDVMGKGVPAALLSANLKASVRAQLQGGEVLPGDLVARVNRLFWDLTPNGLFASLFFAVFDLEAGTLEYVNAGHHYPFVVRADGAVEDLREGGTLLGLVEESSYLSGRLAVRAEDMLVFYTDGVTDRGSRDGEMYGAE